MRTLQMWLFGALALALGSSPALAEEEFAGAPDLGDEAREITATTWLNTPDGTNPAEEIDGNVVLIELWGTWCGPCVRSMPKIESLWQRYKDRGLIVVALTREPAKEIEAWVKEKGYTMPIACDPTQACIKRYPPSSWPSTYVIGKDGFISFVGSPYGAEAAVEKALGIESSPRALLTAFLDARATKDKDKIRPAMEALLQKAPHNFDLKDWAENAFGEEPKLAEGERLGKLTPEKALDNLQKSWISGDAAKRKDTLRLTALTELEPLDLRAWIAKAYGKEFPLKKDELNELLEAKSYAAILDALLDRNPASSVMKTAAKHDGLQGYASKQEADTRTRARKALMMATYFFDGKSPDPEKNDDFWKDISVSGMAMSKDRKRLVGVLIAAEMVTAENAESYADRKLLLWALMRELSAGDTPKRKALDKEAAKERKRIVSAIKRTYDP